jgi:hypothetical protein
MSDDKKAKAATLGAAISMLGLSLGVASPAEAQRQPATPQAGGTQGVLIGLNQPGNQAPQAGGTQGVLIGLDQPGSQQWKSQQYKSQQLKSQQLKSQQIKLQSQQIKRTPGQ